MFRRPYGRASHGNRTRTTPPRHFPAADGAKVTLPFVAVVLAMLPAVLDQTILATALPTIATGSASSRMSPGW